MDYIYIKYFKIIIYSIDHIFRENKDMMMFYSITEF